MTEAKYKRVVLKISGEALAGEAGYGISQEIISFIAAQVKAVHEAGV